MQRHARLVPRALIYHSANKMVVIVLVEEDGDDWIDNGDDAQNQKLFDL